MYVKYKTITLLGFLVSVRITVLVIPHTTRGEHPDFGEAGEGDLALGLGIFPCLAVSRE